MVGRPRIPVARLFHLRRPLLLGRRLLSTTASSSSSTRDKALATAADTAASEAAAREDAYRRVHNLDFTTAADILLNTPPKRKKFGLDFHLVQFFFACMPSLAVYLVAQYARYEIRRMEAEVELKKKQAEEEEKAKSAELEQMKEHSDPVLSKVIVRLDALEAAVTEIVVERKKDSPSNTAKNEEILKKEQITPTDKNLIPQSKPKADEVTPSSSSNMVGGSSRSDVTNGDQNKQGS